MVFGTVGKPSNRYATRPYAVNGGAKIRLGERNGSSTAGKKLKVLVVGDSQLRHVKGEKLENDHRDVEIRFEPGMKIEEVKKDEGPERTSTCIWGVN